MNRTEHGIAGGVMEESHLLRAALDGTQDAVLITDHQLERPGPRILYVNQAFTRLTGYAPEEIIGKTPRVLQGPLTDRQVLDSLREKLTRGESFVGETINYRRDGSTFLLQWIVDPVVGANGRVSHYVSIQRDVTDDRQLESAQRQRNVFLQNVVDSLPAHVAVLDETGRIMMANQAWKTFAVANGLRDPNYGIGKNYVEVCRTDDGSCRRDASAVAQAIQAIISGEPESYRFEYPCHSRSESQFFQVRVTQFREGDALRVVVAHENITATRLAQEALRESEERFRILADTAPVLVWMSGLDKGCTYFNQQWLDFTGMTMESQVGDGWSGCVHPDDLERCVTVYNRAFDRREDFTMEYRLRRHDGEYRWILDTGTPRFTPAGAFAGYIGSCVDITHRKRLQQEIIEAVNREQRRIGHDLHDGAGQELTGVGLMSNTLLEDLGEHYPPGLPLAQKITAGIDRVMSHVRRVAKGLVPVEVDADGIRAALAELTSLTNDLNGVGCELRCGRGVCIEDNEVATQLYRIAQEAVSNSLKHARTTAGNPLRIQISLDGDDRRVELRVLDDGRGMTGDGEANAGLGRRIMNYRAELIGAKLRITSARGQGTQITCILDRSYQHDRP